MSWHRLPSEPAALETIRKTLNLSPRSSFKSYHRICSECMKKARQSTVTRKKPYDRIQSPVVIVVPVVIVFQGMNYAIVLHMITLIASPSKLRLA
jgi:hypothetical protein